MIYIRKFDWLTVESAIRYPWKSGSNYGLKKLNTDPKENNVALNRGKSLLPRPAQWRCCTCWCILILNYDIEQQNFTMLKNFKVIIYYNIFHQMIMISFKHYTCIDYLVWSRIHVSRNVYNGCKELRKYKYYIVSWLFVLNILLSKTGK